MYPQPKASSRVTSHQDFFRILKEVDRRGWIYEIDTSLKGLAIGPGSDISRVFVSQFDQSAPDSISEYVVEAGAPLIGRIDAVTTKRHGVANTDGRILVWSDQRYREKYSSEEAFNFLAFPPVVEIIGYFNDPPVLPTRRADRFYRSTFPLSGTKTDGNVVEFPVFGRKYASIELLYDLGSFSGNPDFKLVANTPKTSRGVTSFTSRNLITDTLDTSASRAFFEYKRSSDGPAETLEAQITLPADSDAFDGTGTHTLGVAITVSDEEL